MITREQLESDLKEYQTKLAEHTAMAYNLQIALKDAEIRKHRAEQVVLYIQSKVDAISESTNHPGNIAEQD